MICCCGPGLPNTSSLIFLAFRFGLPQFLDCASGKLKLPDFGVGYHLHVAFPAAIQFFQPPLYLGFFVLVFIIVLHFSWRSYPQ